MPCLESDVYTKVLNLCVLHFKDVPAAFDFVFVVPYGKRVELKNRTPFFYYIYIFSVHAFF